MRRARSINHDRNDEEAEERLQKRPKSCTSDEPSSLVAMWVNASGKNRTRRHSPAHHAAALIEIRRVLGSFRVHQLALNLARASGVAASIGRERREGCAALVARRWLVGDAHRDGILRTREARRMKRVT